MSAGRLDHVHRTLAAATDAVDRLTTLVFLRQLTDPQMPTLAGFNPRTRLGTVSWAGAPAPAGQCGPALDAWCERLNALLGETLLSTGWSDDEDLSVRAATAMAAWEPDRTIGGAQSAIGGDLLGQCLETYRGRSESTARGAFYTPYNVSYTLASIQAIQPDDLVSDAACGSGRMLLASLHSCREQHQGRQPRLHGIDLDPAAIRVARLNMFLAGADRAELVCGDAMQLLASVVAERRASA